jgi:hypothetical protein
VSPEQIYRKCREQQELVGRDDTGVMFLLPGQNAGSRRKRLYPGGPLGEPVGANHDGRGVPTFFQADEVIAALERDGLYKP